MSDVPASSSSLKSEVGRLAAQFGSKRFRDGYLSRHLKMFLAAQIRALRGDRSQTEFGVILEKPQSVISRLENESYGKVNLYTLIEIAKKLDIGLIVKFVDYPTFFRETKDFSEDAIAPRPYQGTTNEIVRLIDLEEGKIRNGALADLFHLRPQKAENEVTQEKRMGDQLSQRDQLSREAAKKSAEIPEQRSDAPKIAA